MDKDMTKFTKITPRLCDANTVMWAPDTFEANSQIPLIEGGDATPISAEYDVWDCWPLMDETGANVRQDGAEFWFFLSAKKYPDPAQRHLGARIRLLRRELAGGAWRDLGICLPDNARLGHGDWAGSAVLHKDGKVSLFHTAAGSRQGPGFQQRLCVSEGVMGTHGPANWQGAQEIIKADGQHYLKVDKAEGAPGTIKAFRDPAYFQDPATGTSYIFFTATAAWDDDPFNGVVGYARLEDGAWRVGPPLITAIGVNNELERPHVLFRGGQYYLFWSTQKSVFSPQAVAGPNGLYAMTADHVLGPYRPVNGSGLVAANPDAEPTQSYSWWVTGDDEVWSFVDYWGMKGRKLADHPELLRAQFGGTPAPRFKLAFAGDTVTLRT